MVGLQSETLPRTDKLLEGRERSAYFALDGLVENLGSEPNVPILLLAVFDGFINELLDEPRHETPQDGNGFLAHSGLPFVVLGHSPDIAGFACRRVVGFLGGRIDGVVCEGWGYLEVIGSMDNVSGGNGARGKRHRLGCCRQFALGNRNEIFHD